MAEDAVIETKKLIVSTEKFGTATKEATTAIDKQTAAVDKNTESKKANSDSTKLEADEITLLTERLNLNNEKTQTNTEATSANTKSKEQNATSQKAAADASIAESEALARQNVVLEQNAMLATRSAIAQDAFSKHYSKTYQNLSKMEKMGTPAILKAATWTALGVGGVAYEGIKKYSEFNKLMTQTITQAGRAPSEMGFLSQSALNISKQTGVGVNDVANMMYRAASGTASWNQGLGATKKQLVEVTKQVANLNVLGNIQGGVTSEQSARVLTSLLNANMKDIGSGMDGAKKAAMLINAAVGAGDIRQSELVSALGRGVLTSAKANGMSARDTVAWIDLLTSLGTTGSVAGTYVKSGINLLTNPSTQGVKALGMLGIKPGEFQKVMSGNKNYGGATGLLGVTKELGHALKKFDPFKNYPKFKGGAVGYQSAVNLLQTWGINQIPQKFLDEWKKGNLNKQEQMQATSLILTKAFGGSKQFATIASLVNNPDKLAGLIAAIDKQNNAKSYNRSVNIALNTPSAKFHKLLASLNADLISIGKTITPWALKLGQAFVGLIGIFARFKILLLPLVGLLGSIVGMAMLSKGAAIIKGAYPMLGRMYNRGDRIAAGLAGKDTSSKRYGFFGKFIGGGSEFRNSVKMSDAEVATKMGQASIEFGGYVGEFGKIVEVAGAGGGGRGRGGVNSTAARSVENDYQKANRLGLLGQSYFDKGKALTAHEKSILQIAEGSKKPVSQTLVRQTLLSQGIIAGKGRNKEANELVKGTTTKLLGLQTGGGIINSAVKEGMVVSESAAATSGITSAISGIGGKLLGALGGPLGMMAMSTLLPMAMPMIGRAMGWMFGGGGSSFKTHNVTSMGSLATTVRGIKSKITGLGQNKSLLSTPKGILKYFDLLAKQDAASGKMNLNYLGKNFAKEYNKYLKKYHLVKPGVLNPFSRQYGQPGGDPNFENSKKELKTLKNQLKNDPSLAKALKKTNPMMYAQLMGSTASMQTSKDSALSELAAKQFTKRHLRDAAGYIKASGNNKSSPQGRIADSLLGMARLTQERNRDVALSTNTKLSMAVRKEYTDNAKALKNSIDTLHKEYKAAGQALKETKISEASIKSQALQYASANTQSLKNAGFTPKEFANALADALKSSGPTLASLVNGANHNSAARGGRNG